MATQELIDQEVRRIVDEAHHDVTLLLTQHRDKLESLTRELLARETLDEDESYAAAQVPHASPAERAAARERDSGSVREDTPEAETAGANGGRPDGGGMIDDDERPGLDIAPRPEGGGDVRPMPEPSASRFDR